MKINNKKEKIMEYNPKKASIHSFLISVVFILLSGTANAAIENLIIFGDSLSDTGNTRSEIPFGNAEPIATAVGYGSNGRFSNGPLWHEYLAVELGISGATNSNDGGDNFAFGGARVDNDGGPSAGLLRQTSDYFAREAGTPADPDSLFISWIGGNDMRDLVGNADPTAAIDQQLDALFGNFGNLLDSGVTQLLVPNLADLGTIPENRGTGDETSATAVTQAWNTGLLSRLFDLNNSTTADIYFFDVFSLFEGILNDPAASGFTNTTGQCRSVSFGIFENECANASSFVFWDDIHPTTAAHAVLGQQAFQLISSGSALVKDVVFASAPTSLVIFTLGFFGLVYTRKTR
jgi:phospholipase/lecithinase/hemolysin